MSSAPAKRKRDGVTGEGSDLEDDSKSHHVSESAETGRTSSRDHVILDATLHSAGLGKGLKCFLCTFTDEKLADGSMFIDASRGPVEEVKRLWRHGADTMDINALARECCDLLHKRLDAISLKDAGGDESETDRRPRIEDITPEAIKRHFLICETTREARLDALKCSFRHVAQLEHACAKSMYTEDAKTRKARPDPKMAELLLKANSAMMKTNANISLLEAGHK